MVVPTFRRYTVHGYTGEIYVVPAGGANPDTDPYEAERIVPGTMLIRFANGEPQIRIRNEENDDWDLFNWDILPGKPERFDPEDHPLSPSAENARHTGALNLDRDVIGHDWLERTHSEITASGIMMALLFGE